MKALPDAARPYDVVVIDGTAKLAGMIAAAVKLADAVLIPVQPSPYDVWAASDLVDLVRRGWRSRAASRRVHRQLWIEYLSKGADE